MPRRMSLLRLTFAALMILAVSCSRDGQQKQGGGTPIAQKQPVEVAAITRQSLKDTLSVVGTLAANESAEIRPELAGQVKGVFFEEGQVVKAGDVMVRIDDSELRAQYSQTEARYKLAELNLARNRSLLESRMVSQADFDRAAAEHAASSAELSLLKVRLDRTEIKAPFDGITGARSISPGDYITTQTVITLVNDLSRLKIEFQVPERFLAKVRQGTKFAVQSKSISADAKVEGEVYFVSSVIERATRSSQVKGLLSEPPEQLKPGMFANIEIILEVRENVFAVPEGAILNTPSGPQLIVVKDDGADKVTDFFPVSLGLRSRGMVEVEGTGKELVEGQSIVASGVGSLVLFPGAKVDPRPLRREFRVGGTDS